MTQLEALKAIAERNGGLLRPQTVVDEARPEDSPLHNVFEWDDGVAAEKYRLDQAQRLIRSFRITKQDSSGREIEVPVFVGVSIDRTNGKAENPYRLIESIQNCPDLMEVAVKDALDQLEGIRNRHSHLTELRDVWDAIDRHTRKRRK